MDLHKMQCPYCGANIEADISNRKIVFCTYCGSKIHIEDDSKDISININQNINQRVTNDADILKEQNRHRENKWKLILSCVVIALLIGALSLFGLNRNNKTKDTAADIKDNEIIITTEDFGSEEYSIQLVQPEMPMEEGSKYKFSFEAYAEEDRQMKAAVTAPTANWIRYFPDTPVDLTADWQTFEFDMKDESDDKGRVEFNMGNQDSAATIHIRNVRLEKVNQ